MRDRITVLVRELAQLKLSVEHGRTISSSAATLITGFGLQLQMLYQQLCAITDRMVDGQVLPTRDMQHLHDTCECIHLLAQALSDVDGSLRDAMEGSAHPTRKPKEA